MSPSTNSHRDRRGAIAAEASLVMIVLLFFLLLAPALWRTWITDHHMRVEANREAFARTSTFLDLSLISNFFTGNAMTKSNPQDINSGGRELAQYKNFRNTTVVGLEDRDVTYSASFGFRGQFNIERRASLPRPAWTWNGFPFVHTQDLVERGAIRTWYTKSLEESINSTVVRGLQLGN